MQDSTPILVGAGQYVERDPPVPGRSLSPADMNAEAARRALAHAGASGDLAAVIDVLAVARLFEHSVRDTVMWPNPFGCSDNMPGSVARRLDIDPRRKIYAEVGGETPQRLVNQMAEAIHAGEVRAALLSGAEALATIRQAQRSGVSFDWNETVEGEYEDLWPEAPMTSPYEFRHGITFPIQVYCLFEQLRRHELGLTLDAYRERIGRVLAPFATVAAANPYAQFPEERSADFIATPSPANFQLCEPYNKWMVAQDAVNQGAAVVMTSVGVARSLGIPEANWVYLRAYADVDDRLVVERPRLATSEAQGLALRRVLDDSGLGVADLTHIDLYSCFPIAVTAACEYLGIDPEAGRALTVTGGLPFFGGPGNNYSLHGIAEVVVRLRGEPQAHALVAANGGYLSKHSVGIYSGQLQEAWQLRSSAAERAAMQQPSGVVVAEVAEGAARIESYAAVYARGKPSGGYIVGRLQADDRRFLAVIEPDSDTARSRLFEAEPIGSPVTVRHADGMNYFDVD
ncbi:MAG: acetyl-CoA acetyltransferase [Gammaproteobacteria bacterium]